MWTSKFRRSPVKSKTLADISELTLIDLLKASSQGDLGQLKIYQGTATGWQCHSHDDLIKAIDLITAGLISLGLAQGDRVGFLLQSDIAFLTLDSACVQANLVSVPIDLSQTIENIIFTLNHSDARVLFVANLSILNQVLPYLQAAQSLKWIILPDHTEAISLGDCCRKNSDASETFPTCSPVIPPSIGLELCATTEPPKIDLFAHLQFTLLSWQELQIQGGEALKKSPQLFQELDILRDPHDLATLIYIPHEDGSLKGVMLSHENLTSTALATFADMKGLRWGDRESVLTFLPLTHIFARVMLYGHLYYHHRIYFSSPKWVMKHLQEVRPSILSTVPILLHRIFRKLQTYGEKSVHISQSPWPQRPKLYLEAMKRRGHRWAMAIAQQPALPSSSRFSMRDVIKKALVSPVFRQWRGLFGGRIRYCLTGGAALDPAIAHFFLKIGLPVYQGYGLTQTSSVVTFNHQGNNIPGTVGQVRVGAECVIASDGEVLVKGTGVMQGYFKAPNLFSMEMDEQGWFHTGDLGILDTQNPLTLIGRKKSLFKLTTGKYVTPLPLEAALERSPLVSRAFVVGQERKYCAAILFVEPQTLLHEAQKMGLTHYPVEGLSEHPCILALYKSLVDRANCYFPYWSTIKRIQLLQSSTYPTDLESHCPSHLRTVLTQRLSGIIDELYQEVSQPQQTLFPKISADCRNIPDVSCPLTGQSLKTKLS